MPLPIKRLEIHASHLCNMACESCSHFSNNHHAGIIRPDEVVAWSKHWNTRITPEKFVILGGEPTLNPALAEFVSAAGMWWRESQIELYTNGWYIHAMPARLGVILGQLNALVHVSVHSSEPGYAEKLRPNLETLQAWSKAFGFRLSIESAWEEWTRRHHGTKGNVMPFRDGDIRSSWENCRAKHCKQLFEGKIWKCSPQAYFQLQARKYTVDSEAWRPFLEHKPLKPGCTDEELKAFFEAQEEACCSCCPARPEHFTKPLPVRL